MNDNKNFKKRAETMKELFLAGIPNDVISEVVQISDSTIREDRERVKKLYGIELPKPLSPYLIQKDHYNFFFKIYVNARFNKDYHDPLYTAAGIIIDISSIESHLSSLQVFYEALMCPHALIKDSVEKNNMDLIEKLLSDYKKRSYDALGEGYREINFQREFFIKMYYGEIPYESFKSLWDVKQAATKYFAGKKCGKLNTIVIEKPRAQLRPFLSKLSEIELEVFKRRYGLDSEEKEMLSKIASDLLITKNRADNICRRAYDKVYDELKEVDFYPFDTLGRMRHLEKKYDNIKELQTRKFKVTEKEIERVTNSKKLTKNLDWIEKAAESPTHSARVTFLVKKIKDVQLPNIIARKLNAQEHILDIVENWGALHFMADELEIIDKLLKENRVDRAKVTTNDILLARRIIQKSEKK